MAALNCCRQRHEVSPAPSKLLGIDAQGQVIIRNQGDAYSHVVLRGGAGK